MKAEHIIGLIILVLVVFGSLFLFWTNDKKEINQTDDYQEIPYVEIVNPSGFVNTDSITIGELVGQKVILVDFMTYSCINCQRTFPYLNAWYEKYKKEGLEIVGIHTPEFAFEHDIENVKQAMIEFGIKYPVVLDNDYSTWRAYENRYWPRKYLIDINGNIVYDHIGEGDYEETEAKIKELLDERAQVLGLDTAVIGEDLVSSSIENQNKGGAKSPEVYFGSSRNEFLKNGRPGISGENTFDLPDTFVLNGLYLSGIWDIQEEFAKTVSDSSVVFRYYARDVYMVARAREETVVEVYQDGELVKEVLVSGSKLYRLIEDNEPGEHLLELKIKGSGVEIYTFTFG